MISEVFDNQTFCMDNVLYFRGWITQQEFNNVLQRMEMLYTREKACKNGPVATTTNAVDMRDGQSVMDLEILIPLDKEITVEADFKFLPSLRIQNALKVRVEGNPTQLQAAMQTLSEHIQENKLQPITPALTVTIKAATTPLEIDEMITEIFVGVKEQ